MTFKQISVINFVLRGFISLAKFILTFVLASKFDLSVLGEYSLIVNSILVSTFLIGFEVYQYTSRSIIINIQNKSKLISKHFVFIITSFLYLSPLFVLFFIFDILNFSYFIALYILLFFELISNEQYRLLIALKHPVFANIVLFIRTALWVYLFIGLVQLDIMKFNPITMIINFWILGALFSIILPLIYFKVYRDFWENIENIFSIFNIFRIWKQSFILFFASLALILINTLDKFVVNFVIGKRLLGVYALYFSLSSVVFTFVMAGVISTTYPHLVERYKNDKKRYKIELKLFFNRLVYSSLLMGFISIVILTSYLYFNYTNINKYNLLIHYIGVYVILLTSFIIYTLHMRYHYELYVASQDMSIIKSNYGMLIIYILSLIPFTYWYSIFGTACAHLLASSTVFILKQYHVKKLFKRGVI